MEKNQAIQILWDYMCLHQQLQPADCIIGFGCCNEDVARRAAQLYFQGYAPRVLFSGGLGRNTRAMWSRSEAEHFREVAVAEGGAGKRHSAGSQSGLFYPGASGVSGAAGAVSLPWTHLKRR